MPPVARVGGALFSVTNLAMSSRKCLPQAKVRCSDAAQPSYQGYENRTTQWGGRKRHCKHVKHNKSKLTETSCHTRQSTCQADHTCFITDKHTAHLFGQSRIIVGPTNTASQHRKYLTLSLPCTQNPSVAPHTTPVTTSLCLLTGKAHSLRGTSEQRCKGCLLCGAVTPLTCCPAPP